MICVGPIEKLGTIWWFEFFDLEKTQAEIIEKRLFEYMETFENAYSRFISTSLISKLNKTHSLSNPPAELLQMLDIASTAYSETQGIFNIAVGKYLVDSGYDSAYTFHSRKKKTVPSLTDILKYSSDKVVLLENAQIDFGGFGKGFLIDQLVRLLQEEYSLQYFLINGGGDIYATSNVGQPITIGLQHPTNKNIFSTVALYNQAFASSSPYLRQWKDQHGTTHSHLVGSGDKRAVYITAPTATQADIWATVLAISHKVPLPTDVHLIHEIVV